MAEAMMQAGGSGKDYKITCTATVNLTRGGTNYGDASGTFYIYLYKDGTSNISFSQITKAYAYKESSGTSTWYAKITSIRISKVEEI